MLSEQELLISTWGMMMIPSDLLLGCFPQDTQHILSFHRLPWDFFRLLREKKTPPCFVRSCLPFASVSPSTFWFQVIMCAACLIIWGGAGANDSMQLPMTIRLTFPYLPFSVEAFSQIETPGHLLYCTHPSSCLASYFSLTSSINHWINLALVAAIPSGDIQIEKRGVTFVLFWN